MAAVLALCVFVRVWIISRTVLIARDGTTYVQMARQWADDPSAVINNYDYHVAYSAVMLEVHDLLLAAGVADEPLVWDRAGQIVSAVASVAAMVGIWLYAGLTFNFRIAWITALLFGIGRKWSGLGADVLSDALAVCLQIWAVVLAICVDRHLQANRKRAILFAAVVGLCCGAGYLVRPEALLPLVMAVAFWIIGKFARRRPWRLTLASTAAAAVSALACALPYMLLIGGLTKKKQISDIVAWPFGGTGLLGWIVGAGRQTYSAPRQLVNQLFEALHPVVGTLLFVWLVTLLICTIRRKKYPQQRVISPHQTGAFFMLLGCVLITPMALGLYSNVGYLDWRHVMFLAVLLCPLAGAGCTILADWLVLLLKRCRVRKPGPTALYAIVGLLTAYMLAHSLKPLNYDKTYYRDAAEAIGAGAAVDEHYLADSPWTVHYAKARNPAVVIAQIGKDDLNARGVRQRIERSSATHLVLSDKAAALQGPALGELLQGPAFRETARFRQAKQENPDSVRVYQINRRKLPTLRN